LYLNQNNRTSAYRHILKRHKYLLLLSLLVLSIQIILGGWTSTHYAALACGDQFPTCLNSWWPDMDFSKALYWGPIGAEHDYEFGVLENEARAAIQMIHRIGALITAIILASLIFSLRCYNHLKNYQLAIGGLLVTQISLGILNVVLSLPMTLAVLHNAVALLLLLSIIGLIHKIFKSNNQ
jgi:cytochrome c oxidase assembly protein subunit 15